MFNKAKFDALPPAYQAILKVASQAVNQDMLAHYDLVNATAIRSVVAAGAKLRPPNADILKAIVRHTQPERGAMTRVSAIPNATFAEMLTPMKAFRQGLLRVDAGRGLSVRDVHGAAAAGGDALGLKSGVLPLRSGGSWCRRRRKGGWPHPSVVGASAPSTMLRMVPLLRERGRIRDC